MRSKGKESTIPLWDTSHVETYKLICIPDGSRCMDMQTIHDSAHKDILIAMIYKFPDDSIHTVIFDPYKNVDFLVQPDFSNKTAYSVTKPE